ncbi:MAG: hypothetical protein EPO24_09685 [Bacteroidetes bacterium]|nr:MAG: hypothetical protein EPO24_09685 [Bacteroidota bacterium]
MNPFTPSPLELETFLTPQRVTILQIISIAIALSPLSFLFVIVILTSGSVPDEITNTQHLETLQSLSLVTVALCMASYSLLPVIPKILSRKNEPQRDLSERLNDAAELEKVFKAYLSKHVVTLAMFEFPAIFGMVVCLIGAMNGVLSSNPLYWYNIIPAGILLVYVALTFPTKERILTTIRQRFH